MLRRSSFVSHVCETDVDDRVGHEDPMGYDRYLYMKTKVDADLKGDRERNVRTISEMTVLFGAYLGHLLVDLQRQEICCVQLGLLSK